MLKNYFKLFYACVLSIALFSCATDDSIEPVIEEQISPVVFDINVVPYNTLSEYNFFGGTMSNLEPVYGVLPYDLNSTLFTDYAKKKRFIWMPNDVKAEYNESYLHLNFPVGAVLIKNFYYDNVLPNNTTQILETRLMIKKEDGWIFANYVWNDEQTVATFTTQGSFVGLDWMVDGQTKTVNYRIPSHAECFTCHNQFGNPLPIGPKPQNLNKNYLYSDGIQNQLSKLADFGYLESDYPSDFETTIDWKDQSQPLELRARSYLDINCAHCHTEHGYCNYRPMRFEFNLSEDTTNLGVCVDVQEVFDSALTKVIEPGNSERSVLAFRLNSVEESTRMPLFGRTLKHNEGVALVEEWINSLDPNCQ